MSSSSKSSLLWKMSTVKSWRQFLQNNQVNNYFSYNTWNRNYGFLRQTGNQSNQSEMVTHDWLSPDLKLFFFCYRTKWCPIWREQRHQNIWSSQHLIPISTMFCSKYTPCWLWTLSTNFFLFFRMWIFQHFWLLINHHLLVTASVQGNGMGDCINSLLQHIVCDFFVLKNALLYS